MAKVIKRDEKAVEFNKDKIKIAILKAMEEVGTVDTSLAEKISNEISNTQKQEINISEIENLVEDKLMASKLKNVARAYIRYRFKRQIERETYNSLDKEIQGLKDLTSEEVRNNANKAGDKLQTYRPMISDITCINYAKRHIVPEKILKHHQKEIYLHDFNYLDVPFFNCCLINWEDCFENGMVIGNAPIEKPKSISVAINILSQIVAHVSSNCYGGVTLINLTKGLSQYGLSSLNKLRKKANKWIVEEKRESYCWELLQEEIENSMQGLEYEVQTLTNARGEIPSTL